MLEILFLSFLTRRIGGIAEAKGHKGGKYKVLTVVLWFGGEVLGAILGALAAGGDESATCVIYGVALAGAAVGAVIAYTAANNLPVLAPLPAGEGLPADRAGAPVEAAVSPLPGVLLGFLWLLTNVFGDFSWGFAFNLFAARYDPERFALYNLKAGLASAALTGFLQWLLLIFCLPKAKRGFLALWIPAVMVGFSVDALLQGLLPPSNLLYLLTSILSGLTLGVLGWLILKRYSGRAIWWIPANLADWLLIWAGAQAANLFTVQNYMLLSVFFSVVGSLVSSIAIVFILKGASGEKRAASDELPSFHFDEPG